MIYTIKLELLFYRSKSIANKRTGNGVPGGHHFQGAIEELVSAFILSSYRLRLSFYRLHLIDWISNEVECTIVE